MLIKKLIAIALIFWTSVLLINLARPTAHKTGLNEDEFWARKLIWKDRFDIIITGDSRTMIAVSPEVIEKYFLSTSVGNFGFTALSYTEDYLKAAENTLKNESRIKAIVLGISPRSILKTSGNNCFFKKWNEIARNPIKLGTFRYSGWFRNLFEELSSTEIKQSFDSKIPKHLRVFLLSGWVPARLAPEKPEMLVKSYVSIFKNKQIDPDRLCMIVDATRDWRQKGINVFAVRIPGAPILMRDENKYSGFHEAKFRKVFSEAGGIWIETDSAPYHSHDGSHLRYDSAVKFSRYLAKALKRELIR